jgi:hypothetical protein
MNPPDFVDLAVYATVSMFPLTLTVCSSKLLQILSGFTPGVFALLAADTLYRLPIRVTPPFMTPVKCKHSGLAAR